MNADRWQRIEELYHAARLLNDSARGAFLTAATEGDAELRREVESLLVSGASSPGFLDEPVPTAGASALVTNASSLSGRRIGTYSIHERIGAGGMGDVYRAHDSKLRRDVAFKVVAPALIGENDRQRQDHLQRFRHEAHALAALNHPNIAAIYGLEEADGVTALVMELVAGSTLADRIMRGAIPVEEALPIAKQIADALEAAHERGIVHRDLKPANIKLRPDGTVKVLDFGLAKAVGPAASVRDLSQHATNTAPPVTATGVIVGTAAYMSPEQASGKTVDHRTDIWAFGCVLYEMLTGRAAFGGDTLTDTLAAVIRAEPDWSQIPAATPPPIRTLLRRCLDKDTRRRLQAIGETRIVIDNVLSRVPDDSASAQTKTSRWLLPWGWVALLLVAVAALSSLMAYLVSARRPVPVAPPPRWKVYLPPGVHLSGPTLALSPDGSKLVVVGRREGKTLLYLQSVDQQEIKPIDGTAGASDPFFSPDGKWIGFLADGSLKKWPLAGGKPKILCPATIENGAAWLPNDDIVFSDGASLQRVSAQGNREVIAQREPSKSEFAYESPVALPGGKAVMFSIRYNTGARLVAVLTLTDRKPTTLVADAEQPRFIAPGFLVVNRSGTLEVATFDTTRLQVGPFMRLGEGTSRADAQPMADGEGVVSYDVAAAGRSLVYVRARSPQDPRGVYAIDLDGKEKSLSDDPKLYADAALSPDERKLAVDVKQKDGVNEIWVFDLLRRRWLPPFTTGENDWTPAWQDDRTLIFARGQHNAAAIWDVMSVSLNPNAVPTRLAPSFPQQVASVAVAPNHSVAVLRVIRQRTADLWIQPLGGDGKGPDQQAKALIATPADEGVLPCGFSPDGRWLAYSSDTSRRREIYVIDIHEGLSYPVTSDGGSAPCWSKDKDGSQIFYWKDDTVMAVNVQSGETFAAGTPQLLFDSPVTRVGGYDVARDGKVFYVTGYEATQNPPIVFVSDITAKLPPGTIARTAWIVVGMGLLALIALATGFIKKAMAKT